MSDLSPNTARIFSAYLEAVHQIDNPPAQGGAVSGDDYLNLMLRIAREARARYNHFLTTCSTVPDRLELLEQLKHDDMCDAEEAADWESRMYDAERGRLFDDGISR